MFYELFYNLCSEILGAEQIATAQGQMFAQYGAYIFCITTIVCVFGIALKLGDWLINLFR